MIPRRFSDGHLRPSRVHIFKVSRLAAHGSALGEKQNKYVFRVSPRANKAQIKDAVQRMFQKKVVNVNTCNYHGKAKRVRGPLGRTAHWKKAIVTLAEGEKIELV